MIDKRYKSQKEDMAVAMYDAMNTNNSRAQKYLSIMALGFAGGSIYLVYAQAYRNAP